LDRRKNSLAEEYPEIAAEWDYENNTPLIPENFAPHANDKVAWICKTCGFKWKAAIGDRIRPDSTGCPACARKRMTNKSNETRIHKKGSLADCYPELLDEWDYDKNVDVSPDEITTGTRKKAWRKCKTCGYGWYSSINHRVHGRGCPYCNHRIVVAGVNDLATLRPDLLKEWDYSKNTIKPTEVSLGCGKKACWKCSICGHEWSAVIASRAKGAGCPNWREHSKIISNNNKTKE
jgi:DNA-directed RNA polymerase subunit RPC12/RpoP